MSTPHRAAAPALQITSTSDRAGLAAADALCARIVAEHDENFTVASRLLPSAMRLHLCRVYAYARITDDMGDESGADATDALLRWRAEVERVLIHGGTGSHPVLLALRETHLARDLPVDALLDLIAANLQDQRVRTYARLDDLLAYCRLSANPVGRAVLRVAGIDAPDADRLSDDVCTGLQLANMAQDVSVEAARGRSYIPLEDVDDHGPVEAVRRLCGVAHRFLESGQELEALVGGRIRAQLALYRLGGMAILDAIASQGYETRYVRPRVTNSGRARIAAAALPLLASRPPAAAPSHSVRVAESRCRELARRHAANFYWGFVALPRPQRTAVYALYDFAREVDDAVDATAHAADPTAARSAIRAQRDRLAAAMSGSANGPVAEDPVMTVLIPAIRAHRIPLRDLEALMEGVERDLTVRRYESWDDLLGYCDLVAGSVGRMCVRIFGFRDAEALRRAGELGQALQLINILRDVREDAAMGRIYLPLDDLARAAVDPEALAAGKDPGPGFPALVQLEAMRARTLFDSGIQVCRHIPRRAAVCVRTMAGIYRAMLEEIDTTPDTVLRTRVSLTSPRKMAVLARSCL